MSKPMESPSVELIGLALQYLVLPLIGMVVWFFSKLMGLDGRVKVLEEWKTESRKQHKEVMDALTNHNDNIQGRLQSIEEHLRDRHQSG